MNPNKPSPPRSPCGAAPPTPSRGPRTSGEADVAAPIIGNLTGLHLHARGPAPPAQPPTFCSTSLWGQARAPSCRCNFPGRRREAARARLRTGRLEEVAWGWRKAACGPASGRGQLRLPSAQRQIQPPAFWGTHPASPFLSSPSLQPLPPTGPPLQPFAPSRQSEGQRSGLPRPGLFPALLLAGSGVAQSFSADRQRPPKREQKQISELPPPLCSPL